MDSLTLFLRDVGKPRRFHKRWPQVDVTRWPGQELYLIWRHPLIALVVLIAIANTLFGVLGVTLIG